MLDDYLKRLRSTDFTVDLFHAYDDDMDAAANYDLDPFEPLIVCKK